MGSSWAQFRRYCWVVGFLVESAVGGLVLSKVKDVVVGDVVSKAENSVLQFVGVLVVLHVASKLHN